MYRTFISPYYPPYSGYQYLPYNFYRGYLHSPYNNYINSNFANVNQRLYNYGYMEDVFQDSYIMQSSAAVGIATTEIQVIPYQSEHSEQTGMCTTFTFASSEI